jgi:hypothetical protein
MTPRRKSGETNSCWEASPGVLISPRRPLASPAATLHHSSASLWVLRTRASTYALAYSHVRSRSAPVKTLTLNTIRVYEAEKKLSTCIFLMRQQEYEACAHVYSCVPQLSHAHTHVKRERESVEAKAGGGGEGRRSKRERERERGGRPANTCSYTCTVSCASGCL